MYMHGMHGFTDKPKNFIAEILFRVDFEQQFLPN